MHFSKLSGLAEIPPLSRHACRTTPVAQCFGLVRAFLNLWFAKPIIVSMRVAFHEHDGNHENNKNDEDNSDSYKQGVVLD